jgi:hypothetical protein
MRDLRRLAVFIVVTMAVFFGAQYVRGYEISVQLVMSALVFFVLWRYGVDALEDWHNKKREGMN